MTMTDEQRAAWREMNRVLDEKGDSPEYWAAFDKWAALAVPLSMDASEGSAK